MDAKYGCVLPLNTGAEILYTYTCCKYKVYSFSMSSDSVHPWHIFVQRIQHSAACSTSGVSQLLQSAAERCQEYALYVLMLSRDGIPTFSAGSHEVCHDHRPIPAYCRPQAPFAAIASSDKKKKRRKSKTKVDAASADG